MNASSQAGDVPEFLEFRTTRLVPPQIISSVRTWFESIISRRKQFVCSPRYRAHIATGSCNVMGQGFRPARDRALPWLLSAVQCARQYSKRLDSRGPAAKEFQEQVCDLKVVVHFS